MKQSPLPSLRGFVRLRVTGPRTEQFVNAAAEAGIPVWEVRPGEGGVSLKLGLDDFFRLRPLLKRTGCRMTVTGRYGLPFRLARIWRRKFFAAGVVLFAVLVMLLSSLVWDVNVEGNERLAADDVLDAARQEGLYPMQWIWRLDEPDKLSKNLASRIPGVSWVGVERTGTSVTVRVLESALPEQGELLSQRHLVSRSDAVVTEIYAEQGRPVVQRNTRVKKGDVLISGILGDEESSELVVAKGEVRGLVWHEYNISVPLQTTSLAYTGERKERYYFMLGKWAVQVWGYGKTPFEQSRTLEDRSPLTWRSLKLPVGWMTEKDMEVSEHTETLTLQEAREQGLKSAVDDIAARYGSDSVVRAQKILHEKKENGKVYMKVLFEVEERIAVELPLVYDQGE